MPSVGPQLHPFRDLHSLDLRWLVAGGSTETVSTVCPPDWRSPFALHSAADSAEFEVRHVVGELVSEQGGVAMIRPGKQTSPARLIRERGLIRTSETREFGMLPNAVRTQKEVAEIMTSRGIPMSPNHVGNTERIALQKLRRLLGPMITEWEETA